MKIGIPRESIAGETRVAAIPTTVEHYRDFAEVIVESGAGLASGHTDDDYRDAGATIGNAFEADLVLKVAAPTVEETGRFRDGAWLISFIRPSDNEAIVEALRARGVTVLAMDQVPRITRAQSMDALSSMANLAGYRAILEASTHYPSFFGGQVTAAGRIAPAHVLVIGAGVAGLAAIAAAKGLGAVVSAFDTRPSVADQVKSLGANFLTVEIEESGEGQGGYAKVMSQEFIDAEMALFRAEMPKTNVIVTTALIPGRPAPKLILEDMIDAMPPGSVIVDLASEQGGNCERTVPGEVVQSNGVTIVGDTNLPAKMPRLASRLYSANVEKLVETCLSELSEDGPKHLILNLEDPIHRGAIITHDKETMWPPPKVEVAAPPEAPKPKPKVTEPTTTKTAAKPASAGSIVAILVLVALLLGFAASGSLGPEESPADSKFLQQVSVFLLSCFLGWHIVWNVTSALHTPLMSVTNAVSGIILIGGVLLCRGDSVTTAVVFGLGAVLVATINVAGGFLVTQRMLRMFRK